jgi:hypothetical protein
MPAGALRLSVLFAGVLVAGFALGLFSLTLGSFLIWGAIIGVWLAVLARFYEWPNFVGPLYGWAWTIALVVFLVGVIF